MTGKKGQERADKRIINEGLVTFWVPSASLRADEGVKCKRRGSVRMDSGTISDGGCCEDDDMHRTCVSVGR
jgi:hypothetical protein